MAKSVQAELAEIKKILKRIEKGQERIITEERRIEKEELHENKEEDAVLAKEEEQLAQLDALQEEVEKEAQGSPLGRITLRDFTKSLIGAFFGTVGHFAFFYGTEIAEGISMFRASALYVVSFVLAVLFMYFAGFRKVDKTSLAFLPVRVIVIYLTSIAVIVFVLAVFGFLTHQMHFEEIYKTVSTISILAVLGASTADLIGREE